MKNLARGKPGHCDAGRARRARMEGRLRVTEPHSTHCDTQGLLHSLTPTEKETEAERQSHKPRQGRVSSGVRLLEFPLG